MILVEKGHIKLAKEMFDEDFRLGWGTLPTADEWGNNPPAEDLDATELVAEVGRIKTQTKNYVLPDDNGLIEIDGIKWAVSTEPTKYVYMKFVFEQDMNSADTIYQLGIFSDTVPEAGKETEDYLLPTEIDNVGELLLLENQPAVYRNSATREIFEYVITF
jgi:hypothetical protein